MSERKAMDIMGSFVTADPSNCSGFNPVIH